MYYKKEEIYSFSCPREFNAYLKFKEELKEAGIIFHDLGGSLNQEVKIVTNGRFDVDENGSILGIDSQ